MALSKLLPVLDASSMRCRMTKVLSMFAGASQPILRVSSRWRAFTPPTMLSYEVPFTNASVLLGMETVTSAAIERFLWKFLSLSKSGAVTS
jgi:hypothetical protein